MRNAIKSKIINFIMKKQTELIENSPQEISKFNLEETLNYEKNRYKRKGYGLIFSIFIYLSWFFILPRLIKEIYPKKIDNEGKTLFLLSYLIHEFTFIFSNFVMWIIYKLEWDFFERYKVHDKEWPWKNPNESKKWKKLLKDTIILISINHLIILPLSGLYYYISNASPINMNYSDIPNNPLEIILQTFFFMLVEDFTFYWVHRILHLEIFYGKLHKMHHEYTNTISIASEYSHPIDFILGSIIPSSLGVLILGKKVHLVTYMMWLVMRIAETVDGHSGYEFSWSPFRLVPFSGGSEFHNFHHLNFKGNYGSFFTFWDRICNTVNKKYFSFLSKKSELYNKEYYNEKSKKM